MLFRDNIFAPKIINLYGAWKAQILCTEAFLRCQILSFLHPLALGTLYYVEPSNDAILRPMGSSNTASRAKKQDIRTEGVRCVKRHHTTYNTIFLHLGRD